MKLWLVRHAAVRLAPGICYGSTDAEADLAGTQATARALAAQLPMQLVVRSSPLQRCEQLTQSLCGLRADLAPKTDLRLAEMDFGTWEGRAWDSIGEQALSAWTDDFWTHAPGGGETVQALVGRVAEALDETRLAGRDCAWITHAGVIRAAHLIAGGTRVVEHARQWPADPHAFGTWRVLDLRGA